MKRQILSGLLFFFTINQLLMAQDLTVKTDPIRLTLQEGETFTLDILIENIAGLGSFEFEIRFDTDIVQVVESTTGNFLGSTGRSVLSMSP